jgi:PLP dependent protein
MIRAGSMNPPIFLLNLPKQKVYNRLEREPVMFEHIESNIITIKNKVAAAAAKAGREPAEIVIVAVSKTFSIEAIKTVLNCGITDIGESKVQEAEPKITALGRAARWHMIGHLQTNKVKRAVDLFDMIQSVDTMKVAEEINIVGEKLGKKVDCLLEINSSGEMTKSGAPPSMALNLVRSVMELGQINLCGLMTIGPLSDDPEQVRRAFRLSRELYERSKEIVGESFRWLSMGMSGDYEMAIEEGSNMVRIGTAVFGGRSSE